MKKRIKDEIRVIGFDDGPFEMRKSKEALLVGVICRAKEHVEGILAAHVEVDGLDATNKIARLVNSSRHAGQLQVILLNGITFAGFNVVDIHQLNKKTGKIVIAVTRRKPDIERFKNALGKLTYPEKRLAIVENTGKIEFIVLKEKKLYFQYAGTSLEEAKKILELSTKYSTFPETIRLAHMITSGIVTGESSRP